MSRSKRRSITQDPPSEVLEPATSDRPVVDDATMLSSYTSDWISGFNEFWFTPRRPTMLGLIRIFTGLIAFWTLLVWTFELSTFFGSDGLLPPGYRSQLGAAAAWSHLDWFNGSALLWVHLAGLVVVALFTAGVWTRATSVLTALLVISYGNRSIGAGFGLDQINAFMCLYCAVGNSGGRFSVDQWLANRKSSPSGTLLVRRDTSTNIAVRLMQIHLCVVYFFAAVGKLQGDTWWTGEAVWLALASYEYQTIDMTWLAGYMPIVSLMTLTSMFWELLYPALVWPRLTRPVMLAIAIPVHLGIGFCMGMPSFGLIMLVANLSFVERSESD